MLRPLMGVFLNFLLREEDLMADQPSISSGQGSDKHRSGKKHGVPSLSSVGMPPSTAKPEAELKSTERMAIKLRRNHSQLDVGSREAFNLWTFDDLIRLMDANTPSNDLVDAVKFFEKRRLEELKKHPDRPLRELPLVFPIFQRDREEAIIAARLQKIDGDRWHSPELGHFLSDMLLERLRTMHPIKNVRFMVMEAEEYDRLSTLGDSDSRAVALGMRPAEKTATERFYSIIEYAVARGASDIHLEPRRDGQYRVRFRVDGVLEQHRFLVDRDIARELVNVFKIKAPPVRVEEKRLPQDGAITFNDDTMREDEIGEERARKLRKLNLRISTVPTALGEKISARLLEETSTTRFSLQALDLPPKTLRQLINQLEAPQGLIIVTGPTGSGKTTTLYSCLQHLNTPDVNISTVEDPVEVQFEDFNQVAVKDQIGLSFSGVLKSLMRQDPDIILVGETRDAETAIVALQAANTGHLVLTTLHTNDSIGAIPRLEGFGLTKAMILETAKLITAQRLVRKLNPGVVESFDARHELNELFGREVVTFPVTMYRPKRGLERNSDGYSGRLAVIEMFVVTNEIRALAFKPDTSQKDLADAAIAQGMQPLAVTGLSMALRGDTSLDELKRCVLAPDDFKRWEELILKVLVDAKVTEEGKKQAAANS
ncbi:MAG: hypothetical protein DCC49_11005 [Acidobacteria bacterium]|nr:MAG: hypothetical protein DCC49_11005 [Acidobacteriota bacterium]